MSKRVFTSIRTETKINRTLHNVTQVTISNYSKNDPCFIVLNGIVRELPPMYIIGFTSMPYTWSISDVEPFDFSFEINFGTSSGIAVIDYIEQPKC